VSSQLPLIRSLHVIFQTILLVSLAMADADPPTFMAAPVGCVLRAFQQVDEDDVVPVVQSLPDKQCAFDPLPTSLLKKNTEALSPFFCQLFNTSFECGVVPSSFKSVYNMPLLKKADLDPANANYYRLILNLFVVSQVCNQV